jgi:hypothetical protein
MQLGMRLGAQGADVARLHRVLTAQGQEIAPDEIEAEAFGASTLAALNRFQLQNALPLGDTIDETTLNILIDVEQDISITINEPPAVPPAPPPPPPSPPSGTVSGTLTDDDGAPVETAAITLVALALRQETSLARVVTGAGGTYKLTYPRPTPLNLVLRAANAAGAPIAASPTQFNAPAALTLNLSTAPDGIVRKLSAYTVLNTKIVAALKGTPLDDLQENSKTKELTFLAASIATPFTAVADLFIADALAKEHGLSPQTLFGLFAKGTPANLRAALGNLPDAGIDASFLAQILAAVLVPVREALDKTLTAAVGANILPASYAQVQAAELTKLDALRVEAVAAAPYVRGKTPLSVLLAAGVAPDAAQKAFVKAYADNGGSLGPTWKTLRADTTLTKVDRQNLNTVLSAGDLLAGNLPLVKDTLARLAAKTLPNLGNLALLDQSDWEARLHAVDPDATGIPQVLPGNTPADRIARFAKSLVQRIARRYPTTAFAGGLTKSAKSSFASKAELTEFLTQNPTLSFRRSNIDQFVLTNKLTISAAALSDLKTVQRLYRVSPHYATVEALHTAGYKSAQSIYLTGRAPFLAAMTTQLGSAALAKTAYARAQMTYATALATWGRFSATLTGTTVSVMPSTAAAPSINPALPDLQALFGPMDYLQCDDCQSVYSPAAYLVDLLQYLAQFAATPQSGSSPTNAREALLIRRPDINYVALSCNNTNITIAYIDLANEVLEAAIAPAAIPRPTLVDTQGTTAERLALPQEIQPAVAAAAYAATDAAVFPLNLPFDVNFLETTAYIAALGTTRGALLTLFATPALRPAIACAALGLNAGQSSIVTTPDTTSPWTRWGFVQFPTSVIDPGTLQPYPTTPADWVAALNHVPVLMNRSGLTLPQLYQLLEVIWVTQKNVTLQVGTTLFAGIPMLSGDADAMSFTHLDAAVLDRANRYLRLWTASGLQMWELDWALEHTTSGVLDDSFLVFLSGAITVRNQLSLPFQEVLTFWSEIETRDVTSHLGTDDTIVPSTYTEVFANPTMLASWSDVFTSPPALQNQTIVYLPSQNPTVDELAPLNAIIAALGLSTTDIATILAASGAANQLCLATLTALLRYARLASALSLTVTNLTLWIALSDQQPFGGQPADTIECLRRIALLQGTGIAVNDLNYLLRGQGAAQSALAFTSTAATTVLQSVRDAVAKAVAAVQLTLSSVAAGAPIVVTTAKPHGLAGNTPVFVNGVTGIAAANGDFTITALGPTSFSLNGSNGAGVWTGGGTATANLDATINTIVVASLCGAISVSADVVTPVLDKTGLLPLKAATIALLLSPAMVTVDPSQLPAMIAAFTQVAMAGALYTALATNTTAFAFIVENAATFGWLDPAALPLTPVGSSPYAAFERLLQALALQQRQPARTPKLFDVLAQWQLPGNLPATLAIAIAGAPITVTNATDSTPVTITTAAPHGLVTGEDVTITGILGNAAANGSFVVTVQTATTFTLNGSVGSGAWTSGGTVTAAQLPPAALAPALNASTADVTAIAVALNAKSPALTASTLSGTLADMAVLTDIANALNLVTRYSINGATLVQLAAATPGPDTAAAAMGALQAQYPQSAWFAAVTPVENQLRQARRDALVGYLLDQGPAATPGQQFLTTDAIFDYYLIDPDMCACGETTRLLQPSLAIQQFVQQCFLNLTFGATIDTGPDAASAWQEWSWRQQYRLWQANREVFLYPENYVLPELRTNASSFFTDLENDLRQSNCDADAAEAAFENYLRKLVSVSRLVVAAHYNQTNADGSMTLYVFAHTRGTPWQWFYRTRSTQPPAAGVWTAWASMNLDISSEQLMPVIWDQRLYLIWPIFKQLSEKQSDQPVPTAGGNSQPAPTKFWAVQFAMSEYSAGQWEAKHTIDEKMYFATEDAPAAFMFKAYQDNAFNLQIQAFYANSFSDFTSTLLAYGMQSLPDAPLDVTQPQEAGGLSGLLPAANLVDTSQEPSYLLITQTPPPPQGWFYVPPTPQNFLFKNQDLVYGGWQNANPGQVTLYVQSQTAANAAPNSVELLGTITSPRVVVPQQESIFDSLDPFFVADPNRTYLVQPLYFSTSTSLEIDSLAYVPNWTTQFQFETFYHPYARTFLRELEIGGVSQLMARNLQINAQSVRGWSTTFSFQSLYDPNAGAVTAPYPGALSLSSYLPSPSAGDPGETALDFNGTCGGAYSLYNWEVFYHAPMFIASLLLQNQQFPDALTYLEYIFNPTDNSGGATPQRFWEMAPFNAMTTTHWQNEQIQNLLSELTADTQQNISDPGTQSAILAWMADPFDPHMVAGTRISAYAKATVMRFLDTCIAYGDSYYAQYTAETVGQAEQLYILADMILGPAPNQVRLPVSQQTPPPCYASLQNIDLFSNTLVNVENVIVSPEPPQSLVQGTTTTPTLPSYPGYGNSLLFCIPPNGQLLAYWGTVAQRLSNIRNCLNLQGIAQPLPLYAPPINPLQLIEAAAGAAAISGASASAPIYRFATYYQRCVELTNDVRAYGGLILSALEKQDAETLALLRANQELNIQTLMLSVKTQQVTEAQDQITALQNQKAVVQIRYTYYSTIAFMNAWETAAISLQGAALIANAVGVILDMTSGVAHLVPTATFGAAGFGGSPLVTAEYGGENVAQSATSWASVARSIGGLLSEAGGIAGTMGGYQRRQDDWTLQANLANAELTQIASQITAATDRLGIAQTELSIQNTQISNAQAISTFLTNKYTNAQLYNWMISQLTTVYTQAYQLAFSLALQAQAAYQYELGRPNDTFIQFAYWNSQYNGLTAGDSLLFDLRRMEAQYIANNTRELELTKHISMALTQPAALVQLLQTGSCAITLDEPIFDFDHPGQYFRRLRSVSLTVACVTGPYTGVNATLSLGQSVVRTVPPVSGFTPYAWATAQTNPDGINGLVSAAPPVATLPIIATSSGQNDAGLFEVSLHDDRWLPFEGQGAVSTWSLSLDPRDNNFDITSVTDVVLHLRYTARVGGDSEAVRTALKPLNQRTILISVRNTFGDAYYSFFNPTSSLATAQILTLPITAAVFPFSNFGPIVLTSVTLFIMLATPMAGAVASALNGVNLGATFGPSASTTPETIAFVPVPPPASGSVVAALTSSAVALPAATAPGALTLTVPLANVANLGAALKATANGLTLLNGAAIEDLLLLITYSIT